ncbi:MAG TPA: VOC family protein [Acidimicrobiales bacterium]|nr:VOC family protein [Acidimicrobiales bacterium]
MDQRVSLITLGVTDFERACAFYEALGWSGESPDGEVMFFQAGGMIVALWSREKLAEDSVVTDNGGWGGITLAYNTRSPEEVDEVLAQAEAAGGTIARPAAKAFWGGYTGIFLDPDGHPWEVAHNPGWTITSEGAARLH